MKAVARSYVWWPGLDRELETLVRSCSKSQSCQSMPANALRQLFATYGLPQQFASDNGPQFSSVEFATFLARNGVKHIRSSPYHPSTNGLAEHFVFTVKQAMKRSNLPDHQKLMNFLLSYRSIPHSTTNTTPSELFLHQSLRTRAAERMGGAQGKYKKRGPLHRLCKEGLGARPQKFEVLHALKRVLGGF